MTLHGLDPGIALRLLAAGALILLVIYLIRFRKKGLVISSDIIWHRIVGKHQTLWRRILSFLLQVLLFALLIAVLIDPRILAERIEGKRIVLIVDTSAGMRTMEDGDRRLVLAQLEAVRAIDRMGPDDSMIIIRMDEEAVPLNMFERDKAGLRELVRGLTSSQGEEDFEAALKLALLCLGQPRAGITGAVDDVKGAIDIISDRIHALPEGLVPEGVPLRQVTVGKETENIGFTAFDVRRTMVLNPDHEVYTTVRNFGTTECTCDLIIHTEEHVLGKKKLVLPPGGEVSRFYRVPEIEGGRLVATLTGIRFAGGGQDSLLIDNQAYATYKSSFRPEVLLVSEENLFLETVLEINPGIRYHRIKPGEYGSIRERRYDVIICDGFVPGKIRSQSNYLFINPDPASFPWTISETVEFPVLTGWEGDHPVLQDLILKNIHIEKANLYKASAGMVSLISHYGSPLVWAREKGKGRIVTMGFDLKGSDLPLRVAFPLFMYNAIGWLGHTSTSVGLAPSYRIHDEVLFESGDETTSLDITFPDHSIHRYPAAEGRVRFVAPMAGLYSAGQGRDELVAAVNFFVPGESAVQGEGSGPSPWTGTIKAHETGRDRVFWPWIAALFLGLLTTDWILYHRAKLY